MPREREHPVPTQRRVLVTTLDQQLNRLPLLDLLTVRGFDPALPYREEPTDLDGTLYVQDIPSAEDG